MLLLQARGPWSDGNKRILCIPQSITEASPSDCLVSYQGHSLGSSYTSAEMGSVYSTAPADWANSYMVSFFSGWLVGRLMFYCLSTFVETLIPNPVYIYIYIYICVCVCVCVVMFVSVCIYIDVLFLSKSRSLLVSLFLNGTKDMTQGQFLSGV